MKLFAICLLLVGLATASPHSERKKRDGEIFTAWDIQSLPNEERSAPGVLQALSEYDEYQGTHHEEDAFAHSLDTHDEYGLPKLHDEYGVPEVPKIHDEYGPPAIPTLKVVTEHYCPEEDFKQEFVPVPPSPPEIVPLPEIPIVKYEPVPEVVHEEYGIPEIHEEYGPPPPAPLCLNGAPDIAYPFCCPNGATNPYCCTGQWINPTCSEPKIIEEVPEVLAPYPPKRLCVNGAEDRTYPFCCNNGATNEFCCLGEWINPTCSEPTTTTSKPAPLCPNGAPDIAYPFCCENGATNPYCCTGQWINPTCSELKIIEAPYPAKIIEEVTEVLAPYPPKRLCDNYAEDTTYPFCCHNGATNEYCCLGEWINPTCSEPTTTTTPVPATVKLAPYPAPTTQVPKSHYAGKVYSKYEDSHVKNTFETGAVRTTGINNEDVVSGGIIETRVPETVGVTKGISSHGSEVIGQPIVGGLASGKLVAGEITHKFESTGRHTAGRKIVRTKVRSGGKIVTGRKRISGRRTHIIRKTPVHTVRYFKPITTGSRSAVRGQITAH